jgi:hypothetical protein
MAVLIESRKRGSDAVGKRRKLSIRFRAEKMDESVQFFSIIVIANVKCGVGNDSQQ